MASTSLSEAVEMRNADAMIAEFIRHQEAQVAEIIRLQEAQVALLRRMFGSSLAVTVAPVKDAVVDPGKEMLEYKGDSMQSSQDGLPVLHVAPIEVAGEIIEEGIDTISEEVPLVKMDLHEMALHETKSYNWKVALGKNHCKSLMSQLREDRSLMMETYEGRTVLHVASICGCKPLVQQVLQGRKFDLNSPVFFTKEPKGVDAVLKATDKKTKLKAGDINRYFVGQNYSTTIDGLDNCHNGELVGLIRDVINQLLCDKTIHGISDLMVTFGNDVNYNFEEEHIEFMFHHACWELCKIVQQTKQREHTMKVYSKEELPVIYLPTDVESKRQCHIYYLRSVINGCLKLEHVEVLKCLFEFRDWRGNPPFHTIFDMLEYNWFDIDFFISIIKDSLRSSPKNFLGMFINACDARGWTFLHKCAAMGYNEVVERLVEEDNIDLNPTLPISNATPLHLAILHNHSQVVKTLMVKGKIDVNAIIQRAIVYGDNDESGNERSKDQWSPLQLAAVMGLSDVVHELLTMIEEIYDAGKRKNKVAQCKESLWLKVHDDKVSALHMAAASGIPEVLRLFLNDRNFDPLKLTKKEQRSALHFAIDTTTPCLHDKENHKVQGRIGRMPRFGYKHPILKIMDFASLNHHNQVIGVSINDNTVNPNSHSRTKAEYGGKMACVTMLLQSGIDVWQQDGRNHYAELGPQASTDVRLWWYERIAQEILEAKKNLNNAGNAISVVAALVATASYVGPLQPPLGYATDSADPINFDLVQATKLGIRVFVVSNCLSFYLAIGSIMFAVVPSLPMSQEGMFEEWQRSRRSVGLAMSFLLLSILGVLVSFAAASNVGMSNYYSWRHVGLAFYPTLVAGIACLFGIIVFFIRLLRLIFDKNESIRFVYQKLAKVV